MGNTSPEFDTVIEGIRADNERRRQLSDATGLETELSQAAIMRLAIQSAEDGAS